MWKLKVGDKVRHTGRFQDSIGFVAAIELTHTGILAYKIRFSYSYDWCNEKVLCFAPDAKMFNPESEPTWDE